MASKNYTKVQAMLGGLNKVELAALIAEAQGLLASAPEPTAEEQLLEPGHYFEERTVNGHAYLYERWYERTDQKLKHPGRMLAKGTKAEYVKIKIR